MKARNKGFSILKLIFWFLFLGSVAYLGMVISPMYIRHYMIKEALDSLEKDPRAKNMSRRELVDMLHRKLEVNNLRKLHAKDITVTRDNGGSHIVVDYEARAHIMGNLYAVAKFHEEEEIGS